MWFRRDSQSPRGSFRSQEGDPQCADTHLQYIQRCPSGRYMVRGRRIGLSRSTEFISAAPAVKYACFGERKRSRRDDLGWYALECTCCRPFPNSTPALYARRRRPFPRLRCVVIPRSSTQAAPSRSTAPYEHERKRRLFTPNPARTAP